MNAHGLRTRAWPTEGKRREWEAFLGLIFALGVSPVPAGLADSCQRVVRWWQTDSIGREDLRGGPGVHASEGEIDLALARLEHERLLAPFADQPFRFRILATGESADFESAYASDDAEALKAAAIQEQSGWYQEMRTLETALADACLSRCREERFRNDLAGLSAVYAAQWPELECTVGHRGSRGGPPEGRGVRN